MTVAEAITLDAARIREFLPHRYPMLLVDEVVGLVPGEWLVARKAVTVNEPWYAGQEGLAYPPMLLVESWCQSAGILATWHKPNPDVLTGDVMLFGGISNVAFHAPVLPGQVVEHRVEVFRALSDTLIVTGRSSVADTTVLTVGRVVMAMRPAHTLRSGQ